MMFVHLHLPRVISESEEDDDMNDVTEKPGYYEEQEEIKKR